MKKIIMVIVLLFMFGITTVFSQGKPTDITVRAKARDAKFIGTSMGGAMVAIRNSTSGRIMASGKIQGSTGDTGILMETPKTRNTLLSHGGAAKFDTTLMLEEPVLATVEVKGPLAQRQSSIISSTQVWLIPGKDLSGDGIILEMPGFSVDLLQPRAHQMIGLEDSVHIKANVVMMCGCPTTKGGLWDNSDYEIKALVKKEGAITRTVEMHYTGRTSTYSGTFMPAGKGIYEVIVYAYDSKRNNTGVDKTTFVKK